MQPVHQPKLTGPAPIAEHNNKDGEESVNDEVNDCKAHIDQSMSSFCPFVRHWKQGNRSFDDPEDQQTGHH